MSLKIQRLAENEEDGMEERALKFDVWTRYIPRDRVIDGIDQTALLLEGEHNGRRDYVYIYENEILRSIVKQEFKMHMPVPGVPGHAAPAYNLYRDPREEHQSRSPRQPLRK